MSRPLITLTTDFGVGSPYVAEMKAAILTLCNDVHLIDITHSVSPQNIRHGAFVLEQTAPRFPPGSIHVAVVDPGVGTARGILCISWRGSRYIAPDNGLLSRLTKREPPDEIILLTKEEFWRGEISLTFHGRDIMAPAAAHLAVGTEPHELGEVADSLIELDWPTPKIADDRIEGEVLAIDSFGNLITNIRHADLFPHAPRSSLRVLCEGRAIQGVVTTYADASEGSAAALIGSGGWLEIAIVNGDAARQWSVAVQTPVVVLLA